MVLCDSGDIFKSRVDELIGDIQGVKTYFDDILVLVKGILYQHIDLIRVIFDRLRDVGLKFNDTKFSYGLREITYLGYITTQEGIKHDPKKVQGIVGLGQPTTTAEAQ